MNYIRLKFEYIHDHDQALIITEHLQSMRINIEFLFIFIEVWLFTMTV